MDIWTFLWRFVGSPVWLSVLLIKLLGTAVLGPIALGMALISLLGYAAKIVISFKSSKDRYQHLVTDSLYHKNLDNDLGVIFYLGSRSRIAHEGQAILGPYTKKFASLEAEGVTIRSR